MRKNKKIKLIHLYKKILKEIGINALIGIKNQLNRNVDTTEENRLIKSLRTMKQFNYTDAEVIADLRLTLYMRKDFCQYQ